MGPGISRLPIKENPKVFLKKHLSHRTFEKLDEFQNLLRKWNRGTQLVSKSTLDFMWSRHILDSAQLFPLISDREDNFFIDIGTGGGFPGIVLACISSELAPCNFFYLVESNAFKASFLTSVSNKLGLKTFSSYARIEKLEQQFSANFITARAVARLDTLLEWSERHLSKNGKALFLKGKSVDREIKEAQVRWQFDYTKLPSWTSKDGVVLVVENIRKKQL
ncbi:MAG: 16S rRNA (guanine(527)-N(7))-methyltransferase RsmG [Rhodobacteraceae bacterium]|nr:16S rRNA (guanine(527)-N(7))-methyltransferase RsmG [Paracoccaceae bacterium]MCY4251002.1 16S rRNA (guanine(527)-N(7))-methyltransferase RsmG [Paracoccaceae bacterium]